MSPNWRLLFPPRFVTIPFLYGIAVGMAIALFWALPIAHAVGGPHRQSDAELYAGALCIGLRHAYGGTHDGYTVTFETCRPANVDPVDGFQLYWVWFSVNHRGTLIYGLQKVDPSANTIEGTYQLTKAEYRHHVVDTRRLVKQ